MTGSLVLAAMLLFVLAVRMSAFFSGSETGFYRLSRIRLSLEAQAGDPVARRLVWFCRHPERFVATALVGNNIANYITTVAVGFLAMAWTPDRSGVAEIVLTLLSSPIIFIWGELIPKSVYLRAPMKLLRKHARALMAWYYLLRPVTVPLALISRLVERLGSMEKHPLELLFGRNRLVHDSAAETCRGLGSGDAGGGAGSVPPARALTRAGAS